MWSNLWKDLKVHIVLLIVSLLVICKFSDAPPIFDCLAFLLQRPNEGTAEYEILRIAENLSLAYIASLIFYILVDYLPNKRDEKRTEKLLEKSLTTLYLYMDRVVSYFKFLYNVTDFSTVNKKVAKEIDDFQFPSSPEFLVVESTRNEVANGHHVEWFNAKNEIISAGKAISNALIDIDHILAGNKMPSQFLTIINEIRISGLLEKMLKVIPGSHIEADGVSIECGYLNFYEDIKNFEILSKQLEKYHFLKLGTNFRKATAQEIKDWAEVQVKTRTEHPEIDTILKQLKSK